MQSRSLLLIRQKEFYMLYGLFHICLIANCLFIDVSAELFLLN